MDAIKNLEKILKESKEMKELIKKYPFKPQYNILIPPYKKG